MQRPELAVTRDARALKREPLSDKQEHTSCLWSSRTGGSICAISPLLRSPCDEVGQQSNGAKQTMQHSMPHNIRARSCSQNRRLAVLESRPGTASDANRKCNCGTANFCKMGGLSGQENHPINHGAVRSDLSGLEDHWMESTSALYAAHHRGSQIQLPSPQKTTCVYHKSRCAERQLDMEGNRGEEELYLMQVCSMDSDTCQAHANGRNLLIAWAVYMATASDR